MRTHTGESKFVCTLCSKRFTRSHNLKVHKLIHTGENPLPVNNVLVPLPEGVVEGETATYIGETYEAN